MGAKVTDMSSCCSSGSSQTQVDDRIVTRSTITCPHCGTAKPEEMPRDACQIVYQCTSCGAVLRPKAGDCCVFCSYGSVPCPPIQAART